jgi:hypothetical protein
MQKSIILFCFTLFFLIGCKTNKITEIQVTTLAKTTESWNGTQLPKYLDGNPEINAGVLLKGNLRVISKDNDTLNLKAGEPIIELVNSWHYGENLGTEPAEIIVFYAGIKGTPITVLKESNH